MKLRTVAITAAVTLAALVAGYLLTAPRDSATSSPPPTPGVTTDLAPPVTGTLAGVIPSDVTWELSRTIAVPVSASAGPVRTSPEGIRSGFAHTPSGALMAAANYAAADAQRLTGPTIIGPALVDQRVMPWPGQDQVKAAVLNDAANPPATVMVLQIVGFRFLAYDGDHATVLIAQRITSPADAPTPGYAPWINLVWSDNDWWIVPALDGHGQIGTPITWPLMTPDWTAWAGVA